VPWGFPKGNIPLAVSTTGSRGCVALQKQYTAASSHPKAEAAVCPFWRARLAGQVVAGGIWLDKRGVKGSGVSYR
jgi:hypothetical protein